VDAPQAGQVTDRRTDRKRLDLGNVSNYLEVRNTTIVTVRGNSDTG